MIRRELTDDITYSGYLIGEEPVKNTVFNKKVYFLGIKVFEHSYKCNEVLEEPIKHTKKGIGFKEQ